MLRTLLPSDQTKGTLHTMMKRRKQNWRAIADQIRSSQALELHLTWRARKEMSFRRELMPFILTTDGVLLIARQWQIVLAIPFDFLPAFSLFSCLVSPHPRSSYASSKSRCLQSLDLVGALDCTSICRSDGRHLFGRSISRFH